MQKKNTLVWTRDGLVNNFFLNMWRNNSGFSNWVESYAASSEIAITFAVVVTCWTQSIGILYLLVADRHKKLSCCNKLPNDEINMNGKLNNPWLSNLSSVYFFNIVDRQRSIYVTVIASNKFFIKKNKPTSIHHFLFYLALPILYTYWSLLIFLSKFWDICKSWLLCDIIVINVVSFVKNQLVFLHNCKKQRWGDFFWGSAILKNLI